MNLNILEHFISTVLQFSIQYRCALRALNVINAKESICVLGTFSRYKNGFKSAGFLIVILLSDNTCETISDFHAGKVVSKS